MGKCPECGAEIVPGSARKHAIMHWGENIPDLEKYPEAHKRYLATLKAGGDK